MTTTPEPIDALKGDIYNAVSKAKAEGQESAYNDALVFLAVLGLNLESTLTNMGTTASQDLYLSGQKDMLEALKGWIVLSWKGLPDDAF